MNLRAMTSTFAVAFLIALPAHAAPDAMGPLSVTSWDAGSVPLAGTSLHVVVYYPTGGTGPFPLVGVVHGASRNGTFQRVLAQTLASYGLVAVVPDMPCTVFACDHNANAMQLLAMLDWAVTQSAGTTAPFAGLVDATRRGLTGHSWGALASHLAASRDSTLRSVVLLDPNDDVGVGAAAAPMVHVPELQLLAQVRGTCNNQWIASSITPALGGPVLQATLPTSAHCDPEDPSDTLCPLLCGNGDRATTPFFRRYAVAWTVCNLIGDPAMAEWIGGTGLDADVAAGHLGSVVSMGLDGLRCRSASSGDGGTMADVSTDTSVSDVAGDTVVLDVATDARDSGSAMDAAHDATLADDSVPDVRRVDGNAADSQSADSGTAPASGSCRCAAAGGGAGSNSGTYATFWGLLIIGWLARRRRN